MNVQVKVTGLEELKRKYKFAADNADKYMSAAGKEVVERYILPVKGIKQYPPATSANKPPTPYYIRGRGMQRAGRRKAEYNDNRSERYGTRWFVKRVPYGVRVGNSASYAPYLTGASKQSRAMAKIGWRKLVDVANQNMSKITATFQAWVEKLHKDAGLRTK